MSRGERRSGARPTRSGASRQCRWADPSLFLELARLEADDREAASYHGRGDEEHTPDEVQPAAEEPAPGGKEAPKDAPTEDPAKDAVHPEAVQPTAEEAAPGGEDAPAKDAPPRHEAHPEKEQPGADEGAPGENAPVPDAQTAATAPEKAADEPDKSASD